MMVHRDGLFDCIKGGLILLVVLGHSAERTLRLGAPLFFLMYIVMLGG